MDYNDFITLGISLGLGLLVGLQREHSQSTIAGIRTFPLITFLGTLSAFLAEYFENPWLIAVAGLSLALIIGTANVLRIKSEKPDFGQTTEIAILVMFAVGAYLVVGERTVAIALGTVVAVLLQLKLTLRTLVERLGEKDMRAIMQFAAISLIVLPILPDETYDPYGVLNPHQMWWMVVLIVGLSLAGYFGYKWLGEKAGTIANGIFGGMISSTATTLTFAKRSRDSKHAEEIAAFIIVSASAVTFVRVTIEVSVVAPGFLGQFIIPVSIVFLTLVALSFWIYRTTSRTDEKLPEPKNPAQLKSALIFGVGYGLILLAVAAAKDLLGSGGLYAVSVISGFADMDAITLSLANSVKRGSMEGSMAWRLILAASLSNLVFKGALVVMIGKGFSGKKVLIAFGITIVVGLLLIWLWPD